MTATRTDRGRDYFARPTGKHPLRSSGPIVEPKLPWWWRVLKAVMQLVAGRKL